MNPDEIKHRIHSWLAQHYPQVEIPSGQVPLGRDSLLCYYEHMEIAILELKLHDRHPEYLAMIRKRRNYLRRLHGLEFKKEQFRSLSAF